MCKFKLVLLIYQLILNGFCSNMPDFEAVPIPTMEPAPVMVSTPVVVSIPVIPTQMSRCWYRGLGGQENQHQRRYRCRYHITLRRGSHASSFQSPPAAEEFHPTFSEECSTTKGGRFVSSSHPQRGIQLNWRNSRLKVPHQANQAKLRVLQ